MEKTNQSKYINNHGFGAIAVVLIVVLVMGVGFYLYQMGYLNNGSRNANQATIQKDLPSTQSEATITISSQGFSPSSVIIKAGDRVKFTNGDTKSHELVGDSAFDDLDPIEKDSSISVSFDKTGTAQYSDASDPTFKGTIVVQ